MKKLFPIILMLVLLTGSAGCEKDDICDAATDTTPRMVIEFYDIQNPTILKPVTNLKVTADGMENGIVFNPTMTGDAKYLANGVSKIAIPLEVTSDVVNYSFVLNSGNENPALIYTDTLRFNYSRQTIYVSRACGYKVNFALNHSNELPGPFILNNDPANTQGTWIQNITVQNYNLTSENETHLKIYF